MLTPVPHLTLPTTTVRASYLHGETELAIEEGLSTSWIKEVAADFASFVDRRRVIREMWAAPVTELWFVDGPTTSAPSSSATGSPRPWRAKAATSATTSCPAIDGEATRPRCLPTPSRPAKNSAS